MHIRILRFICACRGIELNYRPKTTTTLKQVRQEHPAMTAMKGTDLFMNWIVCCSAKTLVTIRRTAKSADIIVTGAGPKVTCCISLKAKISNIYPHERDPIYTPLVFVAISASMTIRYVCCLTDARPNCLADLRDSAFRSGRATSITMLLMTIRTG